MRFVYADPPYVGRARYYDHPDKARWNDPSAHIGLMHELDNDPDVDGWALSCSTPALRHLLPNAPGRVRVAAWVKPWCAFKKGQRIMFTWEPVLFVDSPERRPGDPQGRDHLSASMAMNRGLIGAKPEAFAEWVLMLLGWQVGDELVDLFPGSGIVDRVAGKLRLPFHEPPVEELRLL